MIAITRDVSPAVAACELTHLQRTPIDFERARVQHEAYRALLRELGCEVVGIPADAAFPDCVFVEDAAVVLDELAVITNPGAASRRGETAAVAEALRPYRTVVSMEPGPAATLDGGDVLVAGRTIFVGRSARTNDRGIAAFRALVAPHGYDVRAVDVTGCLHLKSAVTLVADDALLVHRAWIDAGPFAGWALIDVDPRTATRKRLESRGIDLRTVDADELAKAEGGVTCCALLVS
jgi:dimethylargininase